MTTPFQRLSESYDHRIADLEYTTWGPDGNGGMCHDIEQIKADALANKTMREANEALLRRVVFWGLLGAVVLLSTALIAGRDAVLQLGLQLIQKAVL